MPVDKDAVVANSGLEKTRKSGAQFSMSGATMLSEPVKATEAPEMSVREKMVANGYSPEMIHNVTNAASVFTLPHLMHSNAAGFAADLQQTRPDALNRAYSTDMNMSTASDQPIVDAIEGKIEPSPEMRASCSLASAICAGVPHNMLQMRFASVRGCNWYKNLYATYKAAVDVGAGMNGQASPAVLKHAAANNCDEDFINWVASNVDADESLTQVSMNAAATAAPAGASAGMQQLAWGPLDALASNLKVDGLSPVAIASLRQASAPAEHLMMSGDAASVANTFAAIKQHWDNNMADLYVSSSDAFLGVRRAQAKAASFAHFLSKNVFSKNDSAASAAAGPHADSAVSSALNHVDAQGASVWNKLVSTVSNKTGWPTASSVPETLNQWKCAAAGAAMSAGASNTQALPLAFRASAAIPKAQQVQSIATASAKPVVYSENDAWAAISFPFAGAVIDDNKTAIKKAVFEYFREIQTEEGEAALSAEYKLTNTSESPRVLESVLEPLDKYRVYPNKNGSEELSAKNIAAVKAANEEKTATWPSLNTKSQVDSRFPKYFEILGFQNAKTQQIKALDTNPRQVLVYMYNQLGENPVAFAQLASILFESSKDEIFINQKPSDAFAQGTYARIKYIDPSTGRIESSPENPSDVEGEKTGTGPVSVAAGDDLSGIAGAPRGSWYLVERPFKVCVITILITLTRAYRLRHRLSAWGRVCLPREDQLSDSRFMGTLISSGGIWLHQNTRTKLTLLQQQQYNY